MHKFTRELITEWRRLALPAEAETFVVGVSGGADSLSLLLGLNELRTRKKLEIRLVVAHFNHALRGEFSDADEAFVRGIAKRFGLEMAVEKWKPPREGNIEQNARTARYEFLARIAENVKAYAVLTAHTVNDQAETVLMNLLRGSGVEGLAGMRSVRALDAGTEEENVEDDAEPTLFPEDILLVRPLLSWAKRIDTEAFCRDAGIEYRYDTMNEDTAFRRVRIRKVLLPMLKEFNPKIIETLAKTAVLMQDVAEQNTSSANVKIEDELSLGELRELSKRELYGVLRKWLRHHRGNLRLLELKHTEAIARLIHSRKSGRTIELPAGETVLRTGGKLVFRQDKG